MNKIRPLIKNENIKTWKQVSFRVLVIIYAVILVGVPVIGWIIRNIEDSVYDYNNYLDQADMMAESGDEVGARYYRDLYEASRFFDEKGCGVGDVRYSFYYEKYYELLQTRSALEFLNNGSYTFRTLRMEGFGWSFSYHVMNLFFEMYPEKTAEYYPDTDEIYYEDPDITADLTEEVLKAMTDRVNAEIASCENDVLTFDITDYYRDWVKESETKLEGDRRELETLKASLLLNPENDDLQWSVDSYELAVEAGEHELKGLRLLLDNSCDYGSWQYVTVTEVIGNAADNLQSSVLSTPKQFEVSMNYLYDSYDEYKNDVLTARRVAREAFDIAEYSLDRNIPLPEAAGCSSKTSWQNDLSTLISISAVIAVVLAGTILSQEYSSGSIRLLLIRPRTRAKILLSKFCSLGLFWGMLVLAAYVVLFLLSLVLNGVCDIFVPDIFCVSGHIFTIPSLLSTLLYAAEDMLCAGIFVLLALLLSVLVKKAALSIALPLIGMFFSGSVQTVCFVISSISGKHVIEYTPFPYLDLSAFRTNAASSLIRSDSLSLSDLLFGSLMDYEDLCTYLPLLGVFYLLLICGLEIYFSFLSFRRQQIMN